jgi:hypothetical protein
MHRQTLLIVVVSLLVVASALFMGWAALRTDAPPAPMPLPSPTIADAAPTAANAPHATQHNGGEIDLGMLTIALPVEWRFLRNQWPEAAPVDLNDAPPLLAAWQGGERFADAPLRFTLFSIARNDLSLERYASDVAEQLGATEGVRDIATVIDPTLRSDTLPVAYIRYTQETPAGRMHGHQAATFDATGDQIVIATLVQQDGSADAEELLRTLVGSMHFGAGQ